MSNVAFIPVSLESLDLSSVKLIKHHAQATVELDQVDGTVP